MAASMVRPMPVPARVVRPSGAAPLRLVGSSRPAPVRSSRPSAPVEPGRRDAARVYVRRRVVAVLVFTIAALFGAVQAVAAFGAGPASGTERLPAVHVVQPGETLWSIAAELQPTGDVRGLVRRLSSLNGGVSLQIGQRLVLPDGMADAA